MSPILKILMRYILRPFSKIKPACLQQYYSGTDRSNSLTPRVQGDRQRHRRQRRTKDTKMIADDQTGPSNPDKTGTLNYSRNYVWNKADCLGRGATASVYLGRHRETGEQVAIKEFSPRESRQAVLARQREVELLRSFRHKNVIKLFACEQELSSSAQVIVMVYCQGGSLYTLLEQPQYGFGFPDDEFLTFLDHIACGLKYLRSKGVIHRDIKPGNIMKLMEEDGSTTYVLTDFGAARALDEEETFTSIYGTEEYLHPDMYQRAVLREPGQHQFGSHVDLWSLGVTIYHVATGRLPFQPYGGRTNSQTMFLITTKKDSGVISGVQKQPNGPIEWSRDLPTITMLSDTLKRLLKPVLAGLLESAQNKTISFDEFFNKVEYIVNLVRLRIFIAKECREVILYMQKTDSCVQIQEQIATHTEIPANKQLIITYRQPLADVVGERTKIESFPKTILKNHIFVFEKENYENQKMKDPEIPSFPSFNQDMNLKNDASVARKFASIALFMTHLVNTMVLIQSLLQESVIHLRCHVKAVLQPVEQSLPQLEKFSVQLRKRLDSLKLSQENFHFTFELIRQLGDNSKIEFPTDWSVFCSQDRDLSDFIKKTENRTEEIKVYLSVLLEKLREIDINFPSTSSGCLVDEHCVSKADHLSSNISAISNAFTKHKRYGDLHPHEEFIHKVDRQKLEDNSVKQLSLYQGHCLQNTRKTHSSTDKINSILLRHLTRAGKVEVNVGCVLQCQEQVCSKLDKIDDKFRLASSFLRDEILPKFCPMTTREKCEGASSTPTFEEGPDRTIMREQRTISRKPEISSMSSRKEADALMKDVISHFVSLQTETAEVDNLLKSNTESLKSLTRILQETSSLHPESFDTS